MGKTKPVWMVALQSAANDMGVQLEKGWADNKAKEPKHGNRLIPVTEVFGEDYEVAWHRTEVNNPTSQELWAEESSLP